MCWEDIQLGRELESEATLKIAPTAGLGLMASADPRRTRIGFSNGSSGGCWVGPRGIAIAVDVGFYTAKPLPPLMFTIEEYGKIVCEDWFGVAEDFNASVVVTTSSLRERK